MATANTEQLALSASLFTSSIDAWIPSKFGPKISDHERKVDFDRRLKEAASQGENERLGAGHPDVGRYKPKGPSLSSLEKKLGKVERGQKPLEAVSAKIEDSESDEESRVKIVSRKKSNPINDLLKGKRKTKADPVIEHPLLNLGTKTASTAHAPGSSPSKSAVDGFHLGNGGTSPVVNDNSAKLASRQALRSSVPSDEEASPAGSGDFPFAGPVALTSPEAKRITPTLPSRSKRPREVSDSPKSTSNKRSLNGEARLNLTPAGDEEEERDDVGEDLAEGKMSKTQRRREARKRAKLSRHV